MPAVCGIAEIIRNKITNNHKQDLKYWSFFCCNKSVILAFCSLFQSRAERNIDWIKQWSVKYQLNFDSFILKQVAWFICTCRDLPEVLCSLSNVGKEWFLGAVSALLYSLDKWSLLWNLHNKQFTHLVAFTMYYSNFTAPNRAPSRSHPASVILLLGFSQKRIKSCANLIQRAIVLNTHQLWLMIMYKLYEVLGPDTKSIACGSSSPARPNPVISICML